MQKTEEQQSALTTKGGEPAWLGSSQGIHGWHARKESLKLSVCGYDKSKSDVALLHRKIQTTPTSKNPPAIFFFFFYILSC